MRYNLVTVVWGDEYTKFFADIVIPNLLTPGNIDALSKTDSPVFRIYTTAHDAGMIKSSRFFEALSDLIRVEFNMIDEADFAQKYTVMTKYHKKAIGAAIAENAALIMIGPDTIRAENYMSNLLRVAQKGKRAVVISEIRVAKDTFLPEYLKRFSADGELQGIAPRPLVRLALDHLHPVAKSFFWNSRRFHNTPSYIYFEIPGGGIVARCFHLSPVFINPVCAETRFLSTLDNDYILKACPQIDDIHIASDSDELMSVEMSSLSYPANAGRKPPRVLNIAAFAKYSADAHHRIFIRHKMRFHFDDISPGWEKIEQFSDKVIDRIFFWLRFEPLLFWPYGLSLRVKKRIRDIIRFVLGESVTKKLFERIRNTYKGISSSLKDFLQRMEFNRAVFFGITGKTFSIITGPITTLIISIIFTPHLQGYYYTFLNLLALQAFIELGLNMAITQFASHEWSRLHIDEHGYIKGENEALSRLSSLGRFAFKWYSVSGGIITIVLAISGYLFFSSSAQGEVSWTLPWFSLCALTAFNILLIPIWSILEGCNQVASLYKYRFLQGLCTSIIVWISILSGAGLWVTSISTLAAIIGACLFLGVKYRNFLKSILFLTTTGPRIRWRTEILPMQWRLALSAISGYFAFSLFTPVLFKYHGSVVAGQMGMSLSIAGFVTALPGAWLIPKVPQFGMLTARKDYSELDRVFFRITKIFIALLVISAFLLWGLVYLLNIVKSPIAGRLIGPLPMSIFLTGQVIIMATLTMSMYLRAHKKEPLIFPSMVLGILVAVLSIILGKPYSVNGIVIGYFISALIAAPIVLFIWHRCRAEWHTER